MTDQEQQQAIRRALADQLEGMREECDCVCHHSKRQATMHTRDSCPYCRTAGSRPVPLTAEGLTDVGRLIRAIEAERVGNLVSRQDGIWAVRIVVGREDQPTGKYGRDPDLIIAFLKAVGAWPLKEEAHD